jgi:predicted nucleic acid-binding protein
LERLGIAVRAIPETAAAAIAEVRATTGLRMPDAVVYWMAASNESRLATFDQNLGRQAHADGIALVEPTTDQPT